MRTIADRIQEKSPRISVKLRFTEDRRSIFAWNEVDLLCKAIWELIQWHDGRTSYSGGIGYEPDVMLNSDQRAEHQDVAGYWKQRLRELLGPEIDINDWRGVPKSLRRNGRQK